MIFRGKNFAISINTPTLAALKAEVQSRLSRGEGFALATMNVDHLVKLGRSEEFAKAYAKHDLIVADGNPVVWLTKLSGKSVKLITGSDQVIPLSEWATECGASIAFIGSTAPVLEAAAAGLKQHVPDAQIVAQIAPPFGFDPNSQAAREIIRQVSQSGAKLCFLALGAPKQEVFAALGRELDPTIGFASVGAGLDFIAGHQQRAPVWVRKIAMEWLWRMLSNPRRLAKRYVECALVLPGHTAAAISQRSRSPNS